MFGNLTKRLGEIFKNLKGRGVLDEKDIDAAMRQIRIALLEADVALPVAKSLIADIKQKALGSEVLESITPGQMVVKIVHDHLVEFLRPERAEAINLSSTPPVVIMMLGLQGSGKTTTTAKLARYIHNNFKKKVMMCSVDIYRPAAREQLKILGQEIQTDVLDIIDDESVENTVKRALKSSKLQGYDVLIIDTAGRMQIDTEMMDELILIKKIAKPQELFLVADSMTGQSAVDIAQGFNEALDVTGVILTRVDGDARGGAALAMKAMTDCDITFLGTGEKTDNLELFDSERVVSRILDMGDVVSLVEKAAEQMDQEQAQKMQERIMQGKWNLNDLKDQLGQMQKLGGLSSLLGFLPGASRLQEQMDASGVDDKALLRQVAIINSMTKKERVDISLFNASRKRRVAMGAGVQVSDVNRLLKQFMQMQKMMKKLGKLDQDGMKRSKLMNLFK